VNTQATTEKDGLRFESVSEERYREFARRHGTSDEIGRIGTYFDEEHEEGVGGIPRLYGLVGCGKLCAIACCTVKKNKFNDCHTCKLDSIIVDGELRKRGLAALLVAKAFLDLLADPDLEVTMINSFAVHPGTVKMLCGFSFSKPPPLGAPLVALHIDDDNRKDTIAAVTAKFQNKQSQLRLHCAFCRSGDRRARKWCKPE